MSGQGPSEEIKPVTILELERVKIGDKFFRALVGLAEINATAIRLAGDENRAFPLFDIVRDRTGFPFLVIAGGEGSKGLVAVDKSGRIVPISEREKLENAIKKSGGIWSLELERIINEEKAAWEQRRANISVEESKFLLREPIGFACKVLAEWMDRASRFRA